MKQEVVPRVKILMLSDFYYPILGGTENHVRSLCRNLRQRGHEVAAVTTSSPHEGTDVIDGLPIYRINHTFSRFDQIFSDRNYKFIPPLPDLVFLRALRHLVKTIEPDIIHAHGWISLNVAKLKDEFPNLPLVATFHDYGFICPKRTLYVNKSRNMCPGFQKKKIPSVLSCLQCSFETYGSLKTVPVVLALRKSRNLVRSFDCVILVSSFLSMVAKAAGLQKTRVIPNFLDLENFDAKLVKQSSRSEDIDVVFVGSFNPIKGLDVLLASYRDLITHGIRAKFEIVVKSEPYKIKIPEDVELSTDISHDQVLEKIARSKLVIIPSVCPETMSSVGLEAMALAKPIIATRIGGNTDLVDDKETGLLVSPGNHTKLTEAIVCLLERPELRRKMGNNGLQKFREYFSAKKVIPRIEDSYKETLLTSAQ